ncbi:hypothetical protein CK203_014828 [Vitis vinifera]|uniref:Retrovirus-related Pol polyprotein from transposon TNT 1-94-like beta-barrel domain-containing protein n=1 Tax=Vitis vinifera TaxID=29760 RepID=A0A438JG90_VITVI|nr:hypothetical protein CK203_014828 [Vitis vinifera]
MAVMSFLAGLPSKFEIAKSQILSNFEIGSLQEVFSRILCTEDTSSIQQTNNVLVAKGGNNDTGRKSNNRGGSKTSDSYNNDSSNIIANVPTASSTFSSYSDKTIMVSADEFAKFSQYQESLKISTPVTTLAEIGKTCLIFSSNKWVIDSGAIDHMTGNPKTFSSFRSHLAPSPVTIVDGSTSNVVDLMTKQIIGKGHVSDGLYILDAWYVVSTNVVFSEDTPFYSSPPNSKSEGNGENWLIYQVTIPSIPTDSSEQPHAVVDLLFAPAKPPIVQEYSRHQEIKDTCPALTSSLSDPPSDLDLPIGLRKGGVWESVSSQKISLWIEAESPSLVWNFFSQIVYAFPVSHKGIGRAKIFLGKTGKMEAKTCSTLMIPNVHLMKDDGDPFDNPERYKRLVGKLNYLIVTRPDIA